MTKAPAMAPAIPRSIVGTLRIRLPVAMIGIPTNIQPAMKNGMLQIRNATIPAASLRNSPNNILATSQQTLIASKEITMRIDRIGVSIGYRKELVMASESKLPVSVYPGPI